jgi:hypothetical protein
MLSSIFLLVAVAENYGPRTQEKASWFFFKLITGLVTAMAVSSWHRRQRYIVGGQLLKDPTDGKGLKRWQLGHIIQFAFSESMALYGLIHGIKDSACRKLRPSISPLWVSCSWDIRKSRDLAMAR